MDNLAVAWLVCLARSSKATITVLALQPYLSLTDSQALYGHGLADWLWSDTPLGNQLRRLAGQPIHDDVQDWLQLQFLSESPERQIQQVVNDTQPDLIVIAADSADWWERRLLGELVNPLLHWADRPVLVAKPNMYGGEDKECQSS
jgi:nucleotide-binding universal stress UspA family protein